jgi:hypothetical protein
MSGNSNSISLHEANGNANNNTSMNTDPGLHIPHTVHIPGAPFSELGSPPLEYDSIEEDSFYYVSHEDKEYIVKCLFKGIPQGNNNENEQVPQLQLIILRRRTLGEAWDADENIEGIWVSGDQVNESYIFYPVIDVAAGLIGGRYKSLSASKEGLKHPREKTKKNKRSRKIKQRKSKSKKRSLKRKTR